MPTPRNMLLEDLLGVADPEVALAKVDPDARRRRLTALVNAASLARRAPAVYVVEDAHWIDEVSNRCLPLAVIPDALADTVPAVSGRVEPGVPGAQSIALAPLSDSETAALVAGLLGPDSSVGGWPPRSSSGPHNPFFAEEMVRDLAERGVLTGDHHKYVSRSIMPMPPCRRPSRPPSPSTGWHHQADSECRRGDRVAV